MKKIGKTHHRLFTINLLFRPWTGASTSQEGDYWLNLSTEASVSWVFSWWLDWAPVDQGLVTRGFHPSAVAPCSMGVQYAGEVGNEMIATPLPCTIMEYKTLVICRVIFIWGSNILWLHVNFIQWESGQNGSFDVEVCRPLSLMLHSPQAVELQTLPHTCHWLQMNSLEHLIAHRTTNYSLSLKHLKRKSIALFLCLTLPPHEHEYANIKANTI